MINGMVGIVAEKKLNRKAEDLQYSKEEMEYLATLQPEMDFLKPSWLTYGIAAVSLIVIKYFSSDEKKAEEVKIETVSVEEVK